MTNATLCFLINKSSREILLGFKKVGFGAGKYSGIGGKVEPGETIIQAAIREMEEESGIKVKESDLRCVARLAFWFPAKPEWDQIVYAFVSTIWDGDPIETGEMIPTWFSVDAIPFDRMWQDDVYWLPRILKGERIQAHFTFCQDNETIDEFEVRLWDEPLTLRSK